MITESESRTRSASRQLVTAIEPRIAYPTPGSEPEEFATADRSFRLREITSGLPDDSREEDDRWEARRGRDLRRRVKAARAVVSTTPGLAETLVRDWQRATRFYAWFGITETMFQHGVLDRFDLRASATSEVTEQFGAIFDQTG